MEFARYRLAGGSTAALLLSIAALAGCGSSSSSSTSTTSSSFNSNEFINGVKTDIEDQPKQTTAEPQAATPATVPASPQGTSPSAGQEGTLEKTEEIGGKEVQSEKEATKRGEEDDQRHEQSREDHESSEP
jgi:hypothetical protein